MGLSIAARREPSRNTTYVAAGLGVWLCGAFAIGLSAAMIVLLSQAGWRAMAAATSFSWLVSSFEWSAALIALALPPAAVVSLCAGVAAAETAIGGRAGRILNAALRAGPAVPAVVIGVAALALLATHLEFARSYSNAAAAGVLALFNLPIMTARFRTVIRAVPLAWRVFAIAAGATPGSAFFRVVLPRAWPGILAVTLTAAGQMLGETALLAIVLAMSSGPKPLSVDLWHRLVLPPDSQAATSAAPIETLLLIAAIVALRVAARMLLRRRRRPSGARA